MSNFAFRNSTTIVTIEFMAVNTFKYNAFTIDFHDIAVHFKFSKTNVLWNDFYYIIIFIFYSESSFIKIWIFCTPKFYVFNVCCKYACSTCNFLNCVNYYISSLSTNLTANFLAFSLFHLKSIDNLPSL